MLQSHTKQQSVADGLAGSSNSTAVCCCLPAGTPASQHPAAPRANLANLVGRCHSYKNPLYRAMSAEHYTIQQQQPYEAPMQPVMQVPVAMNHPCRYAQPVTLPELKTARSRSSTGVQLWVHCMQLIVWCMLMLHMVF